jgi:hypothetical protein
MMIMTGKTGSTKMYQRGLLGIGQTLFRAATLSIIIARLTPDRV